MAITLLRHQEQARDLVFVADADLKNGRKPQDVYLFDITPGGGKSGAAATFARHALDLKLVDLVIVIVPRENLRGQIADTFSSNDWNPGRVLRAVDENVAPFVRDCGPDVVCVGYVTSYQAIASVIDRKTHALEAVDMHLDEMLRKRVLLIFDEAAHLADETKSSWLAAAAKLRARATFTIMMTGAIERWDEAALPFVPYDPGKDGRLYPRRDIVYTRRDAMAQRQITPIKFMLHDGLVGFDYGSEKMQFRIGSAVGTEDGQIPSEHVSRVIETFLDLNKEMYWKALLVGAVNHWKRHRRAGHRTRMIVIADSVDMAIKIDQFLNSVECNMKSLLAVSRDGLYTQSTANIHDFRAGHGDVIVTCAMAHEGLDVPDVKHVVFLSRNRSLPWCKQAFDRGSRTDRRAIRRGVRWEQQMCYVWVPADPPMREIIAMIEKDQLQGLKPSDDAEKTPRPGFGGQAVEFSPTSAELTTITHTVVYETLDGPAADDVVSVTQVDVLDEDPKVARNIAKEEKSLRKEISSLAARRDRMLRERGRTYKDLKKMGFAAKVEKMGRSELSNVRSQLAAMLE